MLERILNGPNPRNPIQQSREGIWNKTEAPYPSSATFWPIFIGGIITSTSLFGGHTCNMLLKFVFLSITASTVVGIIYAWTQQIMILYSTNDAQCLGWPSCLFPLRTVPLAAVGRASPPNQLSLGGEIYKDIVRIRKPPYPVQVKSFKFRSQGFCMVQWGIQPSAIRDGGVQLHSCRVTSSLGLIVLARC